MGVIPANFKLEELTKAAKRLSVGRAAGPPGIPNEIIRSLVSVRPQGVLRMYNTCISALAFPPGWKRARLVLIRKGLDKPPSAPSSYIGSYVCYTPQASY